jgi:hypothetical protein
VINRRKLENPASEEATAPKPASRKPKPPKLASKKPKVDKRASTQAKEDRHAQFHAAYVYYYWHMMDSLKDDVAAGDGNTFDFILGNCILMFKYFGPLK